jgi:FtsZ-interacting cell division protein ZipA
MSEMATVELGLAPVVADDNDSDKFDVFSSLRDGAEGEDFSSGIGETVADSASQFDLVAVASGEEELDTFMDDSTDLKDMPAPVDALSLAGKSEINSSENRMSDERRAAVCQGVASAACASCAARDDCPILRMRNFANENLQPAPKRESYLRDLLSDDDDGIVVAGYANPDSGADSTNADITETSDDKTDKLIEQVAPPNQGDEIPTSETTESPDEPADIKEAEQLFLESAIVMEDAADDVDEIREAQPEIVSEVSVNTSGEEYFTEPTEENRPSIEIKQQTSAIISDAVDKENQQPVFQSPDIPTQTQTKTVPSSPGVSEDTQTGDESCNPLENETVYPTASEDKVAASVVENTYDGDYRERCWRRILQLFVFVSSW